MKTHLHIIRMMVFNIDIIILDCSEILEISLYKRMGVITNTVVYQRDITHALKNIVQLLGNDSAWYDFVFVAKIDTHSTCA